MSDDLFRAQASSNFLRPDAPGTLVSVTPPWTVVVFGVMALAFVALGLLAALGTAVVAVDGRGVVRLDRPPIVVTAARAGKVQSVQRTIRGAGRAGDVLLAFDVREAKVASAKCAAELDAEERDLAAIERRLASWDDAGGREHDASTALVLLAQLRAQRDKVGALHQRCEALASAVEKGTIAFPIDATVMDVAVSEGSDVKEGDKLATLAPAGARLVGYLALPESHRSEVAVGMPVQLRFDAIPSAEAGAGRGRVTRLLDELPSGVKIDALESAPLGVFVEVSLDAMPAGSGPARAGMTFGGNVLTRRARIASLLFGAPAL